MNNFAFLSKERVASIRDIQRSPSQALQGVTRVIRANKTLGFFLDNRAWDDLMEDLEALHSKPFLKRVAKARRDARAGKGIPLSTVMKEYGL